MGFWTQGSGAGGVRKEQKSQSSHRFLSTGARCDDERKKTKAAARLERRIAKQEAKLAAKDKPKGFWDW
jgi:hypothetical protein